MHSWPAPFVASRRPEVAPLPTGGSTSCGTADAGEKSTEWSVPVGAGVGFQIAPNSWIILDADAKNRGFNLVARYAWESR